jgi:hypothetical protein
MKNLIKVILILLFAQSAFGQKYKIGLNAGYGTYQMNDLQQLQSSVADEYSMFHVEEVQQFPGYINYSASFDYFLNSKNLVGVHAAYFSTGGRNHVADYSGEYYLNMPVNSYNIGFQYQNIFRSENKLKYYARMKGGISFSNLTIEESITIHEVDSASSSSVFAATSFFAEPSLGALYSLGDNFGINFSLGYQVDIPGALHTKGNKKEIIGSSDSHIQCNWSGLRIEVGLAYYIFKRND